MPFIGEVLSSLFLGLNVKFFKQLSVEYIWLESITALFGGWVVFLLGVYSYVTDTSSIADRTIRVAVADGL